MRSSMCPLCRASTPFSCTHALHVSLTLLTLIFQAAGGGHPATTTQATLQHISGYTPPPSSHLGTPSVKAGSIMTGTNQIPGWSSQNLVQATLGGVYFGGGNKNQGSGLGGSSPASSTYIPKAVSLAALASAAGVLFTLV